MLHSQWAHVAATFIVSVIVAAGLQLYECLCLHVHLYAYVCVYMNVLRPEYVCMCVCVHVIHLWLSLLQRCIKN